MRVIYHSDNSEIEKEINSEFQKHLVDSSYPFDEDRWDKYITSISYIDDEHPDCNMHVGRISLEKLGMTEEEYQKFIQQSCL